MRANSSNKLNAGMAVGVGFSTMNFIQGCQRHQRLFLPECIEDYVCEDNPVRFIDAFVDSLDLQAAGFVFPKENSQNRGRPAYHPAPLLKLYLYGYSNQIRSSRRLEAECSRNLEVIWLMGKLAPDFKTIADFRKDNAQAFKTVLQQFNKLCQRLELFGGELIAIDGTKVKGQNAADQNWSLTKLDKRNQKLEQRLEEYLKALEQEESQEPMVPNRLTAQELKQKIQQIQDQQQDIKQKVQQIQALGQTQLSASDTDSRGMKGAHGHVVGYNVQGAVDAKHHLLVSTEVINTAADQGQLAPMVQAAKAELPLQGAQVVADGAYYKAEDIKSCQEMGVQPQVPEVKNSSSERAGLFGKKDFRYERLRDLYRCPAGQLLTKRREMVDKGRLLFNYAHPAACRQCPLKQRCTKSEYRTVSRWEHEECLERMVAQMAAQPQSLAKRKALIEHCWGTLKWLLSGGFLLKGLKKVRAEVSLAHFAYNLKRALNVMGLEKLLKALGRPGPEGGSKPTVSDHKASSKALGFLQTKLLAAVGTNIRFFLTATLNAFKIKASMKATRCVPQQDWTISHTGSSCRFSHEAQRFFGGGKLGRASLRSLQR
jgi:transposase